LIDGREIVPVDEVGKRHWRSVAVQIISEPEIYHGAGFQLRADARFAHRSGAKVGVQVQEPLRICLEGRSTCLPASRNAKSMTNNLPLLSVLSVGFWSFFILSYFFFNVWHQRAD
jgi:hypothetical protein